MLAPRLANERRALGWNPTLFTQVAVVSYVFWRDLSQFTSSANNTENLGLLLVLGLLLSWTYAAAAVFLLPLGRLIMAPLALHWNRHR